MGEKPIKDNPSLKKLRDDALNITAFKKGWRFLRPLFKSLGAEVEKIDEALKHVDLLVEKTNELTSLPDEFNGLFAEKGWIMYSRMNIDLAKIAIELGKSGKIDEAERVLVEHFTYEELKRELMPMRIIEAFTDRMPLAEKALLDFKEERYYASILVVLSLLDGMVNEIQHKGFFSKDVDLTAWDSIAAHSKGLQKLVSVMSQSRNTTVVETIHIPYRHGIIHGMDLGYDSREVAVKAWVALFSTRDWALLAEKNRLGARPEKPEKSLKKLFEQIQELGEDNKAIANWSPRIIKIGLTCPPSGSISDYENKTPERKLVEFLHYWEIKNFGYMANCILTEEGDPVNIFPLRIREEYYDKKLKSWQISEIKDESPAISIITIQATYEENELTYIKFLQARLICRDDKNIGVVRGKPGSRWELTSWHLHEIKQNE